MYYLMSKEILTVRDVDEAIWRKFRAKTEEEGLKTGEALAEALGLWIEQKKAKRMGPDPHRFLKMEGTVHTGQAVRWSEEIDQLLYGGEQ